MAVRAYVAPAGLLHNHQATETFGKPFPSLLQPDVQQDEQRDQ
jgi:hypothetical protein